MRFRLLVVALALIGCARTPYFVRSGDAAYRRGDYARALNDYETEQRYRPSKELEDKIAATKAKLGEQELKPIETAFAEGRFDDGVTLLVQLDAQKQKQPPVQAFVKKQEKRLHDELAARTGRKEWGRAFVLASRARSVFPAVTEKLPDYGRNWADALRTAVADADKARNEPAGVFLRAALAIATGDRAESARAKQALVALRARYALALEVRGKGDIGRVQSALSADPRFAMSSANSKATGKVIITLGAPVDARTTTRGREKTQVQKGTRTVENPQHRAAALQLEDKEEALASYKQQRADEMNSPSRTKENIEAFDYQISVAQGDVDAAREDLRNTPATIQEPNYVDVPFEVETHTLTVSRDAGIDVDAPWKRDVGAMRENVKVVKSDKAHAAIAEAGLGRDPVELPTPAALAPDLDRAVVTWLESALVRVISRYHGSLLDAMPRDQAVPLVIALSPKSARKADLAELEKGLGIPMGDSLIDALATDKLAMAFDAPERPTTTNAPATAKTATAVTPRSTPGATIAPTPGTATPAPVGATKPTVPTDPMLAKAGYALTVAPFTFARAGKVVLEVDRDGTVRSGKTVIGVLRPNGVLVDPVGKIVLAIDKGGALWMPKQGAPVGKLSSGSLSFTAGGTLSFDSAGHLRMRNPGGSQVAEAVLSPNTPTVKPAAMIVAWLGAGKLGLRPER